MSVESRGFTPPPRLEVLAAVERSAIDQCLSGNNPAHHRINDLGKELSDKVYRNDALLSLRDDATKLHQHVGRLQFQMEDLYDQLHRTRKASLPSAELLERLRDSWFAAANEAQQFAGKLFSSHDADLIVDARTYAAAVQEMANIVATVASAATPDTATAPGEQKLAA